MDLERAMKELEIDEAAERLNNLDHKLILVAPASSTLPDDGFLKYSVAVGVASVVNAPEGSVLTFREEDVRLLEMLIEYQDLFEVKVRVIVGLPASDYEPWFNSKVWSQDEVSYSDLVSDLSILQEEEAKVARESMTVHEKEREQFTRADGSVRDNTNFETLPGLDLSDDSEAE